MDRVYDGVKIIFLTGFMGAGKSTIGKIIAEKLNYKLLDTDAKIETTKHKSIAMIFQEEGEAAFRSYETDVLKKLPVENTIVTTGGGIVVNEVNREIMREKGSIVYLHCDIERILERTKGDTTRPLLQNKSKEQVNELFLQRKPFYEDADYKIDTTNLSISEIVDKILLILNEYRSK
ncbi:shikimate kinase [Alkalihalobacterium chitinilyticum]|uniref:Shikimate kinase n=1 Tax=Alkalihalobacterium chitinilyticum TaxID=2980103 RepID=A0ABT5V9Z6_9BACI|nr:shikimate kinase [Alkalihalobacterium chitinilyticum]MDE5412283.1 shikimate kinase [Alkalihalobacterium chitinilyticum]